MGNCLRLEWFERLLKDVEKPVSGPPPLECPMWRRQNAAATQGSRGCINQGVQPGVSKPLL
jgi:hypothetical protein